MVGPTCWPCSSGAWPVSVRAGTSLTEVEYQRRRAYPIMRPCLVDANELAYSQIPNTLIDRTRAERAVARLISDRFRTFRKAGSKGKL
jgi:hypothetical protein